MSGRQQGVWIQESGWTIAGGTGDGNAIRRVTRQLRIVEGSMGGPALSVI